MMAVMRVVLFICLVLFSYVHTVERMFPSIPYPKDQVVKLETDRELTIRGNILLINPPPLNLPKNSCVKIRLEDTTIQDISSYTLAEVFMGTSTDIALTNNEIPYIVRSKKPIVSEFKRYFAVSAVVNMGWCSRDVSNGDWIREGDYKTSTSFQVPPMNEKEDVYTINIMAEHYPTMRV